VYMIVSNDVIDNNKYQTFKTALIGNIINNPTLFGTGGNTNLDEVFDAYWIKIAKPLFAEENSITGEFLGYMEKNKLKDFLVFTPFPAKKRLFTFTTEGANTQGQQLLIKGLGATSNQNTNNQTWDDESTSVTDVFISKAKLN